MMAIALLVSQRVSEGAEDAEKGVIAGIAEEQGTQRPRATGDPHCERISGSPVARGLGDLRPSAVSAMMLFSAFSAPSVLREFR
jgi:hypothetical protein